MLTIPFNLDSWGGREVKGGGVGGSMIVSASDLHSLHWLVNGFCPDLDCIL